MSTPAVLFAAPSRPTVGTVDVAAPGLGEVLVRTRISALSTGTERWMLTGRFSWHDVRFPCVPGYQRYGTVAAVGDGVEQLAVGDAVAATRSRIPGTAAAEWGAHTALAVSPAEDVLRVPPGVDPLDAAAVVAAQVGLNAAERVTAPTGSWALVYGDGLIGQLAAQAAHALGLRPILVGHHRRRLELAARCGIEATIDNRAGIRPALVRAMTGGDLPRVVLDTVQADTAESEYLALLDERPEIVYCGFTPAPAWADMARLQQREATVQLVSGWRRERLRRTLELMAEGALSFGQLVTDRVRAEEAAALYERLLRPGGDHLGLAIDWDA